MQLLTTWVSRCKMADLEMSEPNTSVIKPRANETFGEMYARFEREAWASGGYVTAGAVMIISSVRLLGALAIRPFRRLLHRRMNGA
jgi:hypothetical protein